MLCDHYQNMAKQLDIYPKDRSLVCHALGLCGEAGEVADKIKKVYRDNNGEFTPDKYEEIAYELGDVLWYLANVADDIGYPLSTIASMNLTKLFDRKSRNKLGGSGDLR